MIELIDTAELGEEGRNFLASKLGSHMVGLAEEQIDRALQELKTVDPDDSKAVRKWQNEIWLGERFKSWLLETIMEGEKALEIFRHESKE